MWRFGTYALYCLQGDGERTVKKEAKISKLLSSLGSTHEEIIRNVRGVRGSPYDECNCVVANFLRNNGLDVWGVNYDGTDTVHVFIVNDRFSYEHYSPELCSFMEDFDHGRLAVLIEPIQKEMFA